MYVVVLDVHAYACVRVFHYHFADTKQYYSNTCISAVSYWVTLCNVALIWQMVPTFYLE